MADCNFRFANNLAYTEDSVLIFNLFIYKISSKVTEKECRQYLTRFGEINRFRFNVKPALGNHSPTRHAFVNYKTAETAAIVLRKQYHTISPGKVFSIKACDSWHQPQSSTFNPAQNNLTGSTNQVGNATTLHTFKGSNSEVAGNTTSSDNRFTLSDLDEDCLLTVFKYLPLRDQVSLARSHCAFESAFITYAKIYHKSISTENLDSMSLWNIRQLFVLAGEFVEKFTFVEWFENKDRERIANFVQNNCPNLRRLKLDAAKIRVPNLHKILKNKLHLTHLNLNCLSINDRCVHPMQKTPTLEHLSIVHCYNFTGRFLHLLPQLKSLRLVHCSNLQSASLYKAICAMPNLVALDITGSEQFKKSFFDAMPSAVPNLEILQMSCVADSYDKIAFLPKLRCLRLHCDNPFPVRETVFCLLDENCSDQLESLQVISRQPLSQEQCQLISKMKKLKKLHVPCNAGINGNTLLAFSELRDLTELKLNGSSNLTNSGLLAIVRNCPKLKWVNVQNTSIDNDFAKELLPIIKKRKRENGCLTFLVAGSEMNEFSGMPQEYQTKDMKSLVQFVFKHMPSMKNYDNFYDAFENDYNDMEEVPFFETDNFASDSDYDDDDDDDSVDLNDLDDIDFLLNMPLFQHFAIRDAIDFGGNRDPDDDDLEDPYLW